jgi:hypothetical protein
MAAGAATRAWVTKLDGILDSAVNRSEALTKEHARLRRYDFASDAVLRPKPAAEGGGPKMLRTQTRDGREASVPDSPENRAKLHQAGLPILE